jgi:Mg-chelatase subunit ChlD
MLVIAHRRSGVLPGFSALTCILLAACGDGGSPTPVPDSDTLTLAVRPVVDSESFHSDGDFVLDLVPSDLHGNVFLEDQWTISTKLTTPASARLETISKGVERADTQAAAATILIDDSGSMEFSDPERHRATAAQLFWGDILAARPGNAVALLDFGRGQTEPTPGFEETNLLAGFTADEGVLEAALDQVQAVSGGGTPLYRSAEEVIAWVDTTAATNTDRTLVVITDGKPGDVAFKDSLFAAATRRQVRIFAVGLGVAAQQDPVTEAAALLQEIASRTGGIYAAADSAVELQSILQTLTKSVSPERLLVHLRLTPAPAPGTSVAGSVSVSGERGSAEALWSFVTP